MYNSQEVANAIKKTARQKQVSLKTLLSDCGLGINLISQLANGQAITYINLAKIADYLDCSVDYLLGRQPNQPFNVRNTGDNVGVVGQANAPVTIHNGTERQLSAQEQDLLRIYNNASGKQQLRLMKLAYEIEECNNKEV